MKGADVFLIAVLAFILGVFVLFISLAFAGVTASPADRYTVAELTDAIATREADFAERAVELEGEK